MGLGRSKEYFQGGPQIPGNAPIPCPPGTYGDTTGNTASTCSGLCSAGYYCTAGSTSPTQNLCPAGSYCLAGTGDPLSANPPAPCPAGASSSTGASVCSPCNDGHTSVSGGLCTRCTASTYSVNLCGKGSSNRTAGQVTTLTGTPGAGIAGVNGFDGDAFIYTPTAVVVDSCGSLFVTDSSHTIRKIFIQKGPPKITLSTVFVGNGSPGYFDTGYSAEVQFNTPQGLAIDLSDNIYVADTNNHVIRQITPLGVVTTIAGNGFSGYKDGLGQAAMFNTPTSLAIDSTGNIYVADKNNSLIRKIAPDRLVTTFAGTPNSAGNTDGIGTLAKFRNPSGIAVDSTGNLYIADTDNNLIRRIAPNGAVTTVAGKVGPAFFTNGVGSCARFNSPTSIAIDANGALYVCDRYNNAIRQITLTSGTPRTGCGTSHPGIATVTTFAGTSTAGSLDGTGASAQFNAPYGIFIDLLGNLYVADTFNSSIRVITLSSAAAPPLTCLTLCRACCPGLEVGPGSSSCVPYPGYVISVSGATTGLSRGLCQDDINPIFTGALTMATWRSAFSTTLSTIYGQALTSALGYYSSKISDGTLYLFPGWVAFGYINDSPATRMRLDITPYRGTTVISTNTYALMIFRESEITYTSLRPYSGSSAPSSTSLVPVPTLSYSGSGSASGSAALKAPLPQVVCGSGMAGTC